jgi:hypothetical protein
MLEDFERFTVNRNKPGLSVLVYPATEFACIALADNGYSPSVRLQPWKKAGDLRKSRRVLPQHQRVLSNPTP